jgi:hypothetical protein
MGSLWTRDNNVLVDASGHPIWCDNCPCGCSGCEYCKDKTLPCEYVTIRVSGFYTNLPWIDPCPSGFCEQLNGDWELPRDVPGQCSYTYKYWEFPIQCSGPNSPAIIFGVTDGYYVVQVAFNSPGLGAKFRRSRVNGTSCTADILGDIPLWYEVAMGNKCKGLNLTVEVIDFG